MTISQAAIDLIKASEGWVDHAYPDPATGGAPWTIGYGHTSAAGPPSVKKGMTITKARGEEILAADLRTVEAAVLGVVKVPLNDDQLGALVSFAFNLGIGNLRKSTLLKKLNAGDYAGAAGEFDKWIYANHKTLPGLVTRRAKERDLFLSASQKPQVTPKPVPAPSPAPVPPSAPRSFLEALWRIIVAVVGAAMKRLGKK